MPPMWTNRRLEACNIMSKHHQNEKRISEKAKIKNGWDYKKEHEKELVELIITDISAYVHEEETDFKTTQHLIGMDLLFRG